MKAYSLFIGRWQPWHEGHRWLIDQRLNEGKNVWIGIRNVEPSENQPWTPHEVMMNIQEELNDLIEEGRIFISIVPDIESVNYGRGVGYEIIEHVPPEEIKKVSATKIRAKLKEDGSYKETFIKTVIWRTIATFITFTVAFTISGSWKVGLTVGGFDTILKTIGYFGFERYWENRKV